MYLNYLHALFVFTLAIANCPSAAAEITTTINSATNWGTWEGWGVSLAWWAKAFGDHDDLADIFFTLNTTIFNNQTLPGLGLNIVRYNAGASSLSNITSDVMVVSPSIMKSRQVDGYWLDHHSTNSSSTSWNWDVDSNQRNMLLKARDRGVDIFELFSNSPMWWMCSNHNPSGSNGGSSDNLPFMTFIPSPGE